MEINCSAPILHHEVLVHLIVTFTNK